MTTAREQFFGAINALCEKHAQQSRVDFGTNDTAASILLNKALVDVRQWRRWKSGRRFMRAETFNRIKTALATSPAEISNLNAAYQRYSIERSERREKRVSVPRERLTEKELEFIDAELHELGITDIRDLSDPAAFKSFANHILDPRFSRTMTELGAQTSSLLIKLSRSHALGTRNPQNRRKIELLSYWHLLLNADLQDNEALHKSAISGLLKRFGNDSDFPLVGYSISAFPQMFYQSSDSLFLDGRISDKFAEAEGYSRSVDFAKAFDEIADPDFTAAGVVNLMSSAEYNLLRSKLFMPGASVEDVMHSFKRIDQTDRANGAPPFMRMYNWLGIADAMMLLADFERAFDYLESAIADVSSVAGKPLFQIARAEYKQAICLVQMSKSKKDSKATNNLANAKELAERALQKFKGAGNTLMAQNSRRLIEVIDQKI
jgi:hypothetical protein